jgi:hypothetical protein
MIELLLPCGFDTLEYSWVNDTIGICTLADYSVPKKHQHLPGRGASKIGRIYRYSFECITISHTYHGTVAISHTTAI